MKISPLPLMRSDAPVSPVLRHTVMTSEDNNGDRLFEMLNWIADNVTGGYTRAYVRSPPRSRGSLGLRLAFRFELEDDAFRFKLWWG